MVQVKKDKISGEALGTGRRKTAVARVRVRAGSGNITINKRPLEEYFPSDGDRRALLEVLDAANQRTSVDVAVRVTVAA